MRAFSGNGGTYRRRIGVAYAATIAGLVAACDGTASQPSAASEKAPPVPVVTASVRQEDVPIILTGLGTVQALNTATIRSQVTGYLDEVTFKEGQVVKRGDVLARIDPRVYQAKLEQAQGQLGRDQALLENQKTNLARDEPLLQRGFATDQQVTGQRARVSQSQSTLEVDRASIDYAKTELDFATLRAPFDGITGFRLVDIGNLVRPTDAEGVVVLAQMQPISVIFTLPASDIPKVQAALERGTVEAEVYDQEGSRKLDTGALLLINNTAQANTDTIKLKANFPNAQRQLWPGTFVNARLTTSVVKNAITVPTNALQQSENGQFVFVVGTDDAVAVREVQVAQRVAGKALVSEGLRAGETVVVKGQYRLVSGTIVKASKPDQVPDVSPASAGLMP